MTTTTPKEPDGKWGWMVVLGSFFAHVIIDGMYYSFGIVLRELREYFDETRQKMGLVASASDTIAYVSVTVSGILLNRYGYRKVGIAGGLVSACGLVMSSCAPSMNFVIFSHGVVTAFGYGLIYLPAVVSVTHYFDKRRSFAVGLAVSGAGIGTLIFGQLIDLLQEKYGWRGTFLIEGAIVFNCITCAALYRPLASTVHEESREKEMSHFEESRDVANGENKQDIDEKDELASHNLNRKADSTENHEMRTSVRGSSPTDTVDKVNTNKNSSLWSQTCGIFADRVVAAFRPYLRVLKSKVAVMWAVSDFLIAFGITVTYVFVPDVAVVAGFSQKQAALLISITGLSSTISRVVLGWVAGRSCMNRPILFAANVTFLGVIVAVIPSCTTSYALMAVAMALFGASHGYRVAQTSVVMVELIGPELLALGVGLCGFTSAITAVFGGTLSGTLFDLSGTYSVPFCLSGVMVVIGSAMHWAMLCTSEYKQSRAEFKRRLIVVVDETVADTPKHP